jgi:SAM-dependent methyltransferase
MHNVLCILCKRENTKPHIAVNNFTIVKCACGFMYMNPRPTEAELAMLYSDDYVPYKQKAAGGVTPEERWLADHSSWYFKVLRKIKRALIAEKSKPVVVDLMSKKTVLDFGYGNGRYLLNTKELHPLWTLYGYDIDPRPLEGITTVSDLKQLTAVFDLVRLNHVLEHVPDPKVTLIELTKLLTKGGKIVIEVPNIDCWKFRVFGKHYGNLCLPYHLWHFSPKTLQQLLEQSGLAAEKIELTGSTKCTVRSLYNILRVKGPVSPYVVLAAGFVTKFFGEKRVNTDAIRAEARPMKGKRT